MAGVKGRSGRYKKGTKLNKTISKSKPILKKSDQNKSISEAIFSQNTPQIENKTVENAPKSPNLDAFEPQIPTKSEVNFDDAAAKIAQESAAAVESDTKKAADQSPDLENPAELDQNPAVEDDSLKPMISLGYNIIGQILKETTGVNEADYTPDEVKELSEHTNKIIITFWPECTKGLTPQQQALLFSGAAIVNIHVEKAKLIFAIKKMELEKEKIKLEQLKLEKELKEKKENESQSAA